MRARDDSRRGHSAHRHAADTHVEHTVPPPRHHGHHGAGAGEHAAHDNIVAIPLAAGVLAWAGIVLAPAVGAVLTASTVIVAINAQLLRRAPL